jgi:hypothetical protein
MVCVTKSVSTPIFIGLANSVAYYGTEGITAVKSFMTQALRGA